MIILSKLDKAIYFSRNLKSPVINSSIKVNYT